MNLVVRSTAVVFTALALGACGSDGAVVGQEPQRVQEIEALVGGDVTINVVFDYDSVGRLVRSTESRNGDISEISEYVTRSDGRILSRSEDRDVDGTSDIRFDYEYEDGIGLIQINVFDIAEEVFTNAIRYTYENNLIVTRDSFDISDVQEGALIDFTTADLLTIQTYEYDGVQLLNTNFLDGDGELRSVRSHAYNLDGTLATTTTTSINGGTNGSSFHVYENGPCFSQGTISTNSFNCVR